MLHYLFLKWTELPKMLKNENVSFRGKSMSKTFQVWNLEKLDGNICRFLLSWMLEDNMENTKFESGQYCGTPFIAPLCLTVLKCPKKNWNSYYLYYSFLSHHVYVYHTKTIQIVYYEYTFVVTNAGVLFTYFVWFLNATVFSVNFFSTSYFLVVKDEEITLGSSEREVRVCMLYICTFSTRLLQLTVQLISRFQSVHVLY